jgi:Flp pilus assembly protein TadD
LQEALELHPLNPDLLYNLACCQVRSGNLDDAWSSLRTAVQQGFDDVACLLDDPDLKSLRELKEFSPLLG